MATLYWIGGTSTWDTTAGMKWAATSGGAGGQPVPTSSDDVIFDANSTGSCTIPASSIAYCQSLTMTGTSATLTEGATAQLFIGGANAGPGNVALACAAGSYTWNSNATIIFTSTAAAQQTITTNGCTVPNLVFNGLGGNWKLIGDFTCNSTGSVNFTAGSVDWNGANGKWGYWQRNGTLPVSLTLGTADVTLLNASNWNFSATTNLTLSASASTIRLNGTTQIFQGGGFSYGAVIISSSTSCAISNATGTISTLTYAPGAVITSSLIVSSNLTVSGTFSAIGNSVTNRAYVTSNVTGTAAQITAASVSLANVDLMDITALGAAVPWTGTSLGDAQGNSGITFAAGMARYAVAAGNWSSAATWSTSSGGAPGASVPLPQDDVFLDSHSSSGTYAIDIPRFGRNMDCTGFTQTITTAIVTTLFGSMTLSPAMALLQTQTQVLAGRGTHLIRSNGNMVATNVTVDAAGGSYGLADDFSSSYTSSTFKSISGNFNDNGHTVTFGRYDFSSHAVRTVTMTGTWNMIAPAPTSNILCAFDSVGLTLNATTATFVVTAVSTTTRYFYGSTQTVGTLSYTVAGSTGALILANTSSYGSINFSDASNARTLTITAGQTITVLNNFNVVGTAGKLMTINSTTAGTTVAISKPSGVVSDDYLSLQDVTATGGATWYAGAHSTNVSHNSGWIFQKLAASGGGNWTSGSTWVGGVAPTASDVAVLDGSSGDVTIDTGGAVARALDCTAYTGTLTHLSNATLALGDATPGSNSSALAFSSAMTYTLSGGASSVVSFVSTTPIVQTITSAGKTFGSWSVNGSGASYQLADSNTVTQSSIVSLTLGTLNTNNQTCNWGNFSSTGASPRTLTLGSSSITLTSAGNPWTITSSSNITLNANTSTLIFNSLAAFNINTGNYTYNNITVTHASSTVYMDPCTITGTLSVTGGTTPGSRFCTGGTVTVTGSVIFAGNSITNRLLINSNTLGSQRVYALSATGIIGNLNNVDFSDVAFSGTNVPVTGTSLGDCLGNNNIVFDTPITSYWVGNTGNWSDVTHWASSSGGTASSGRVPLPQDNAVMDANSFSTTAQTVNGDMARIGKNLDFSTVTHAPSISWSASPGATFFGSWNSAGLSRFTGTSGLAFILAGRGSHTFTTGNKPIGLNAAMAVNAPGGTYQQQDASYNNGAAFVLNAGTFDTNNYNIVTYTFSTGVASMPARSLLLGTSIWSIYSLGSTGIVWNVQSTTGLTMSVASGTIVLATATNNARTFVGGSQTYGTLTYAIANSPGALLITGTNTFTALNVGSGRILTMPSSNKTTVTNFNITGSNYGYLYLPGVSNNYASVPNSTPLQITGDIDVTVALNPVTWQLSGDTQSLVAKRNGASSAEYAFRMYLSSKNLEFYWFENGTAKTVASDLPVPFNDGQAGWLRVTRANSGGPGGVYQVIFYTSTDGTSWTQLGSTQNGTAAANPTTTTNAVLFGALSPSATSGLYQGILSRVIIKSGISGSTQLDANFTAKPFGANTFIESSSNAAVVSIVGDTALAGDGRVVLNASTPGTSAPLSKPYGMVNADYVSIQDSAAGGGATWYAGSHSTNVSNNSGWVFNGPPAGRGGFLPYFQ